MSCNRNPGKMIGRHLRGRLAALVPFSLPWPVMRGPGLWSKEAMPLTASANQPFAVLLPQALKNQVLKAERCQLDMEIQMTVFIASRGTSNEPQDYSSGNQLRKK